jgi:ferritin heavy chain
MSWLGSVVLVAMLAILGHQSTSSAALNDAERAAVNHDAYRLASQTNGGLQKQINMELKASLIYLQMAAHFQKNTIARKGFFRFFQEQSDEEKKHAHKLIHYLNLRGNENFTPFNVPSPTKTTWESALDAINDAIALEKELLIELEELHKVGNAKEDPHLMDFLENEYLSEQVSSINSLTKLKTVLSSFGVGQESLGEYHVDKQLMKESGRKYFEDEL